MAGRALNLCLAVNVRKFASRSLISIPISQPFHSEFTVSSLRLPIAKYGGRQMITVLPGDGIGPEMIDNIRQVFAVAQAPIDFEEISVSSQPSFESDDFEIAMISIGRNGIALKGNIETKFDDPNVRSRNMELRTRLELYANVLHCRTISTIPVRHRGIDVVLIRENTEGEYSGLEHEIIPGVIESLKIVTRSKIEKIARFAFEYANKYGRKKVTAIHKANIMKLGDGLFLTVCRDMANEYKNIEFDSMIVDNACMQLVSRPQQFDVMLMPNLYGNIISNIACGLVGGPGLVPGSNIGDVFAVFETGTRNTGTSLAGKNLANPTAFLLASVDMLRYLKLDEYANRINGAIWRTLIDKKIHTPDVGGVNETSEFIDSVIEDVARNMQV